MKKYVPIALLACLTLMSISLFAQQNPEKSQIEIINIETGEITVVKKFNYRVEAPEFTPDGKWMYFNSAGFIYRMSPEGGEHFKVPTGKLTKNINDHVISPDGKWLATTDGGTGLQGYNPRIYVVPIDGGDEPLLVTRNGNSALHGWSPDGKLLTFTGRRGDENRDIYTITLDGETETRLTTHPCWEDGSEFTPDGKYIWYNSSQSGLMQLWRMKADGSEKTHMLKEEANCWFPHPSRDGKWISYIAYKKGDVAPEAHPPRKDVSIRLLPAQGGESKLLVEFFGGQGSFNVNSWAPDSKRLAYVRFDRPEPPKND